MPEAKPVSSMGIPLGPQIWILLMIAALFVPWFLAFIIFIPPISAVVILPQALLTLIPGPIRPTGDLLFLAVYVDWAVMIVASLLCLLWFRRGRFGLAMTASAVYLSATVVALAAAILEGSVEWPYLTGAGPPAFLPSALLSLASIPATLSLSEFYLYAFEGEPHAGKLPAFPRRRTLNIALLAYAVAGIAIVAMALSWTDLEVTPSGPGAVVVFVSGLLYPLVVGVSLWLFTSGRAPERHGDER